MRVFGITGGIGMGKSTSARLLRGRSIPVVDTDDLARDVVEPGQPALAEVQSQFGATIVDENGRLRRKELAQLVFADPAARRELEHILHPRIRALWLAQVNKWKLEGRLLAVVVIPLLFETGADKDLDETICVACTFGTQRQRLLARGWPAEQIEQRIQAQLPVDQKMGRADFVVWTEPPGTQIHEEQLERILRLTGPDLVRTKGG
jgi:dephospho-CoA kinase